MVPNHSARTRNNLRSSAGRAPAGNSSIIPAEGRFSEKPHANENGHVRKSVSQSVSQSQRANQKRERTGSRMIPENFLWVLMMFLIRKKCSTSKFDDGMVLESEISEID